ncbi:hypothetical protein Ancab_002604, partial [Ancistrocladus abbreviatus]
SFTGVLKSSCLLSNLFDRMLDATVPFCDIRPIGGRLVLMTTSGESDMASVVAHNWDKLSLWFDEVRPGKKEDVRGSRLAIVCCSGVPLHVWSEEFFELLVKQWGTIVSMFLWRMMLNFDNGLMLLR